MQGRDSDRRAMGIQMPASPGCRAGGFIEERTLRRSGTPLARPGGDQSPNLSAPLDEASSLDPSAYS
jgi:hypothetical protein